MPFSQVDVLDRLESQIDLAVRHGRYPPRSDSQRLFAQPQLPHAGPGVEKIVLGGRAAVHDILQRFRRPPLASGDLQHPVDLEPVRHNRVRGHAVLVRLQPKRHNPSGPIDRLRLQNSPSA